MRIAARYDAPTNRLLLDVPFMLNEVVRTLPSRRFLASVKCWAVPLIMANVRALDETAKAGVAIDYQPSAAAAIESLRKSAIPMVDVPFPRAYQHRPGVTPMKHQQVALDRAWNKSGYGLFMEMGTGKTLVAITLACARYSIGEIDRLLVLCPMSVRRNWIGPNSEFEKYATVPYDGLLLDSANIGHYERWMERANGDKLRVLVASIEGLGISARQYEMCRSFVRDERYGMAMIACDESTKIKNPQAVRTERSIELSRVCVYKLLLNGTPIANGVEDLYAQVEFMNPNILGVGDFYSFRNRYCVMGGFEGKQIVAYRNMPELTELLAPWTYEVRKADALDLPPKTYETRWVKPTKQQAELLSMIRRQPLQPDPATGQIPTKNILERMLRLQQVVGGFYATLEEDFTTKARPISDGNPKLDELMTVLEETAPAKVIVWARYRPEIEAIWSAIRIRFGHDTVVQYHGGVDEASRNVARGSFQDRESKVRFFVGNQSTGGLGIELYAAGIEVYYSNTFSYVERIQSEDRAHRKGLVNPLTIIDLMMEKTIDELVAEALTKKADIDRYVRERMAAERNRVMKLL